MQKDASHALIKEIFEHDNPNSLRELRSLVSEKFGIGEDEAMSLILSLESEGRLSFYNGENNSFTDYLQDINAGWFWAYASILLTSFLTVLLVDKPSHPLIYLRHALGILYVLYLPGYALVKVIYPLKQVSNAIRAALSITLSLVVVPSIGYFLNFTSWGIGTIPVNTGILLFSMTASLIGLYREYQGKQKDNQASEAQ